MAEYRTVIPFSRSRVQLSRPRIKRFIKPILLFFGFCLAVCRSISVDHCTISSRFGKLPMYWVYFQDNVLLYLDLTAIYLLPVLLFTLGTFCRTCTLFFLYTLTTCLPPFRIFYRPCLHISFLQ